MLIATNFNTRKNCGFIQLHFTKCNWLQQRKYDTRVYYIERFMHILIFHMNSDINVHLSRFISYGRKSTKRGEDGKGKKVFVVEHCHRAKREKTRFKILLKSLTTRYVRENLNEYLWNYVTLLPYLEMIWDVLIFFEILWDALRRYETLWGALRHWETL